MASCAGRFCDLCDPTSVRAEEWCSECDDFLCMDCAKHHKLSKVSKFHYVTSINMIKDYEELPSFVSSMKFYCEDHGDKLDAFCASHSVPCCIRCVLSDHKKCHDVAPLLDLVKNSKSSPQMLEIEDTLKELKTFVERVKSDKETNKNDIKEQQNRIRDEIRLLRQALNDHIDTLEQSMLTQLNETAEKISTDADKVLNGLHDISLRIQQMTNDSLKLKENVSDLQTFLGIPHLVSKITNEEKNIEKMKDDGNFDSSSMVFIDKPDFKQTLNSVGDIIVDVKTNNLSFKVEKEKQAQIIGFLPPTCENIKLKLSNAFHICRGDQNNIISGCSISSIGNIFFSEYNTQSYVDRVTMHSSEGSFLSCIAGPDKGPDKAKVKIKGSMYDVISIDNSNIAVIRDVESPVFIVNILTSTFSVLKTNVPGSCTLYSITKCGREVLAVLGSKGIFISDSMNAPLKMIKSHDIQEGSYIASNGTNLVYTSGDETVQCCSIEGELLWTFEETSVLRSPRGITTDRDGYIYVVGEESENIVVLSSDGKSWKDVQCIANPRAICYSKTNHQLLVCNINNNANFFDILSTL